jgi:hypothetical protein
VAELCSLGDFSIMNRKQQKALIIGGALLALMVLFPPWVQTFSYQSMRSEAAIGYSILFEPPKPKKDAPAYGVRVDSVRWTTQLLMTALLTGIAFVLLKDSKKEQP